MKLLRIEWSDAWSDNTWSTREEMQGQCEPVGIVTVGYEVEQNSNGILVASKIGANGTLGNVSFIPRVNIRSIQEVVNPVTTGFDDTGVA